MIHIQSFTFNPFQENTYLLYDDTNEGVIIDPGCSNNSENKELSDFVAEHGIKVVRLLNTHCHVDHIYGNQFVVDRYGILPEMHEKERPVLNAAVDHALLFGIRMETPPEPTAFFDEGDIISFGNSSLDILFTPGHAPGHVVFVSHEQQFIIGGDVLFYESIGRTDLPYCNHNDLIESIQQKLYTLEDGYVVYPGHGPATSIGHEKVHNHFVRLNG